MILLLIAVAFVALSPALEPQQREFHESSENYEIDFRYPVIAGADQFNAAVSQIIRKPIETFKDQFNAPLASTAFRIVSAFSPASPPYCSVRLRLPPDSLRGATHRRDSPSVIV